MFQTANGVVGTYGFTRLHHPGQDQRQHDTKMQHLTSLIYVFNPLGIQYQFKYHALCAAIQYFEGIQNKQAPEQAPFQFKKAVL